MSVVQPVTPDVEKLSDDGAVHVNPAEATVTVTANSRMLAITRILNDVDSEIRGLKEIWLCEARTTQWRQQYNYTSTCST